MAKFTRHDPTEIVRSCSEKFPTMYFSNGLGGYDRCLEVQFGLDDLREIEFSIDVNGTNGYEYVYLNREDVPELIKFLQEYVDA